MMREDYNQAMRQQELDEEEKYKMSIQYQDELEKQLEEQVCRIMYGCFSLCLLIV